MGLLRAKKGKRIRGVGEVAVQDIQDTSSYRTSTSGMVGVGSTGVERGRGTS